MTSVLLAAAGCGGNGPRASAPRAAPAAPRLPHAVGEKLASESDAVADALAAGDCERGRELALHLQSDTIAAINARQVPTPLLEDLQSGANVLVDAIQCAPPPPPPTTATTTAEDEGQQPPDEHGHGPKKGHGKHGGEGGD